jgi:hypothetical protein
MTWHGRYHLAHSLSWLLRFFPVVRIDGRIFSKIAINKLS